MSEEILNVYPDLNGREEAISASLSKDLKVDLLKKISAKIKNLNLNFIRFDVNLIRRSNEGKVGSDMIFDLQIIEGNNKISKSFLSQAKIGKYNKTKGNFVTSTDHNILKQAQEMLLLSSDSFFFIYTERGIKVVSVYQVDFNKKNSINSDDVDYMNFDEFMTLYFKCFIGDHKISKLGEGTNPELEKYIQERECDIVQIKARINPK